MFWEWSKLESVITLVNVLGMEQVRVCYHRVNVLGMKQVRVRYHRVNVLGMEQVRECYHIG